MVYFTVLKWFQCLALANLTLITLKLYLKIFLEQGLSFVVEHLDGRQQVYKH